MNLLEIRNKVIELSGRYNYVTTSGDDNGANFFIQAATRALDRAQEHSKEATWYEEALAIGECTSKFSHARVVSDVWFVDADGTHTELEGKTYRELLILYPTLQDTDSGAPVYWAPNYITRDPSVAQDNLESHGVIIMPPTDAAVTLRVYGKFYSKPLTIDADENYWSVNQPDILIIASIRAMDYFARNSEGAADYARITQGLLIDIDKDAAEWNAAKRLVMRG